MFVCRVWVCVSYGELYVLVRKFVITCVEARPRYKVNSLWCSFSTFFTQVTPTALTSSSRRGYRSLESHGHYGLACQRGKSCSAVRHAVAGFVYLRTSRPVCPRCGVEMSIDSLICFEIIEALRFQPRSDIVIIKYNIV